MVDVFQFRVVGGGVGGDKGAGGSKRQAFVICYCLSSSQRNEPNNVSIARNSGHLSPHSICGLTTKIKMAENTSRRRSRNVLDYSERNALSSVVLYNTSKRKKT